MSNRCLGYKSDFIATFKDLGRHRHYYEVFRDFVHMTAFSIHNSVCKDEGFEAEYLEIAARYSSDQVKQFSHLLGLVILALDAQFCDFLGQVFMELELGSAHGGQFFTPYPVSKLMAQLTLGDGSEHLQTMPYITLSEPTCGAGGMVIALAEAMREADNNPQTQLWVCCQDIDSVAAMMCYIQIAILGIPGVVITGNSLKLECRRAMYTPFHYLFNWEKQIADWKALQRFIECTTSFFQSETPTPGEEYPAGEHDQVEPKSVPGALQESAVAADLLAARQAVCFTHTVKSFNPDDQLLLDF